MKVAASLPRDIVRPAVHFRRAVFAAVRSAMGKGDAFSILARFPDAEIAQMVLSRGSVAAATTTQAGWAAELAHSAFRDYLVSLAPESAAARLIELGIAAKLGTERLAVYPVRTGGPTALAWVAESGAIPVGVRPTGQVQVGPTRKLTSLVVWSHELDRKSDASDVFQQMLREDVGTSLDAAYFSTSPGSSSAHAGLLAGLSPLSASTSGGKAAMFADLFALITAVSAGGSGRVLIVVNPVLAALIPLVAPDNKLEVLASAAVPANRVIAIDPLALLHATDQTPDIDVASDTALHMENANPTQISAPGTPNAVAAPVVSLYQTAQLAARVLFEVAFAKRRANAVAYIDGINWAPTA